MPSTQAERMNQLRAVKRGELLREGVVRSVDGGVTWLPYGPTIAPAPVGVVHSPAAGATFAWAATCGPDAVRRLADVVS